MYPILLASHSLVRWLVLASLLYAIIRAYLGWRSKGNFTAMYHSARPGAAAIPHIQFLVCVGLYFIIPIVDYFLHPLQDDLQPREIRFFGMEQSVMMFLAVAVISIGAGNAKRETKDAEKFKIMAI